MNEVEQFLNEKQHVLDKQIRLVREIILQTDKRIDETIKWSAPTFMYKGNIASFNLRAKKHVSLMFHKGAILEDPTGILEGNGKQARVMKFKDVNDIENKKTALENIIKYWIVLHE